MMAGGEMKQRSFLAPLWRLRAWIRPSVRDGLDGLIAIFGITLFFCLVQSAHDGLVNRNRAFDSERWWYPLYNAFQSDRRQS